MWALVHPALKLWEFFFFFLKGEICEYSDFSYVYMNI